VGQVAGGARGRLAGGARGRLAGGAGAPAVTEPGPSTPRAAMVGPPASMAPGRAAGATAGPPPGTAARAMVLTVAVRTGGGWSRRSVLAAGAAGAVGLLTGCAWWRPDPSPPPPDPLTPLVATATALVAAYDRTIAA